MTNRNVNRYHKSATRKHPAEYAVFRHTAIDEVDAIYANHLVKRENSKIRRQRRAVKRAPVTLAKMPWDE